MKKKTFTGILIDYKALNCSYYGNPKYYGVFENEQGEILKARTTTDAACAYGFKNDITAPREITYHTTRTGNNIIDYIKILK